MTWNTFHITCPLWRESTSQRWIPLTKGRVMWGFEVFFVVRLYKHSRTGYLYDEADLDMAKWWSDWIFDTVCFAVVDSGWPAIWVIFVLVWFNPSVISLILPHTMATNWPLKRALYLKGTASCEGVLSSLGINAITNSRVSGDSSRDDLHVTLLYWNSYVVVIIYGWLSESSVWDDNNIIIFSYAIRMSY